METHSPGERVTLSVKGPYFFNFNPSGSFPNISSSWWQIMQRALHIRCFTCDTFLSPFPAKRKQDSSTGKTYEGVEGKLCDLVSKVWTLINRIKLKLYSQILIFFFLNISLQLELSDLDLCYVCKKAGIWWGASKCWYKPYYVLHIESKCLCPFMCRIAPVL